VVRWLTLLAVLALGFAACGSSDVKGAAIKFGRTGGSIRPQRFDLEVNGMNPPVVLSLDRQVRAVWSGLDSRQCTGTLPDVATEYIRFEGRTVRVHGNCESAFTRLWNTLFAATG
jgi:hypothetical protein